jgi:hypothetical protein
MVGNQQVMRVIAGPIPVTGVVVEAALQRNAIRRDNARTTAVLPGIDDPRACPFDPGDDNARSGKSCPREFGQVATTVSVTPARPVIRIDYANSQTLASGQALWSANRLHHILPDAFVVSYVDIADEVRDSDYVLASTVLLGLATGFLGVSLERAISAYVSRRRAASAARGTT